jgi:hypothetical protein
MSFSPKKARMKIVVQWLVKAGSSLRLPSVRRQMVKTIKQFLARQAALRHQTVDLIGAERAGEITRRYLLVRSRAN